MSRLDLARIKAKCEEDGDCLIWNGRVHTNGAPSATEWVDGEDRYVGVRRRAYEEYHGVTLAPTDLISTCGHPACLAKKHLERITASERNRRRHANADVAARLRLSKSAAKVQQQLKGKLTPEQVAAIRNSEEGPYRIAKKLGVNGRVASRIKRGLSYREYAANPFSGLLG